jgi:AraC family transcriptional activator FtrA
MMIMPNAAPVRRRGRRAPARPANLTVAGLVYDGLATFEFGIATDVFALRRSGLDPWYDFTAVPVEPGPLRADGGVRVTCDRDWSPGFEALDAAGLIVVPGWRIEPREPPGLIEALRRAHRRGARVLSICSGAFLLARAGLLAGRSATTHWRWLDDLAADHPDVTVLRDVLYVDEGSVLTSAGSAAGLDCCLHLVRRDFGVVAANAVARSLLVPPMREGGQAQYVERPAPPAADRLAATLDWARARLDRPILLEQLADRAGLSRRTLARRFAAATGQSPGEWIVGERVARARELLEEGIVSVDEAAAAVGLGVDALRRHFRARLGVSPSRYRARFGAPPDAPAQAEGDARRARC